MKAKGKFLKQAAGILLCLAMVLGCLPTGVSAAEGTCTESGCGGSYDNGFCSLCGGYEAPELVGTRYEIANAGQLYWFADRVNSGEMAINGVLVKDITVNERVLDAKGNPVNTSSLRPWTPIGRGGEAGDFYGDFDGDGYVIRGLYCVTPKNDAVASTGLFGVIHSSTIQDLLIRDSYFEGVSVGAFASWAIDSAIINCHSSATVKGYENAGGIVANVTASSILSSGSIGRTIIENPGAGELGGILGRSMLMTGERFATVIRCYYNGTLEREGAGNLALDFMGALVGNIQFVALSESYYLDTLGDAIGSTEYIYDDTDYSFDEGTVLPKTRSEFANGTVCELMGFHPGIDNPRMDTEEACLLCPEVSKIHIPVEQIHGEVLLNIAPGKYTLPESVLPANASCKEILWTVLSGPATVSGSVLNATAPGTIELQATVKNGGVGREDFLRSYTIRCTEGQSFDISGGSVIIEKHNDTQWKITYGWVVTGTETFIQNADQPVWITGETRQHSITVKSGATPTIGLRDCSILAGDNKAGLGIEPGGAVTLQLNGENVLASSASAGIAVPEGAELTITGNGSLLARTDYTGNAAIGGTVDSVNCGTVNIYSGTVTAEGAGGGAPIGGGNDATGGHGGSITIYGGTVTAISKGYSAGIGGGQSGGAGRIEIHGGTVTVRNTDPYYEGACIGTGWAGSGGSVTITGGTVVASNAGKITGFGIGGDDVAVTISGGTVSAEVSSNYGDPPLHGTVVITGGNVKATAATAPTDGKGTPLSLHTLTVMGASEDSIMEALEGVTYGLKDVKLLDGNKLYCYLPENTRIPSVTLDGKVIPDAEGDLIFCDHSFVWTVFKESTCTEEGIEVYQCEICGYHKEVYETILAPGPYPESDHPRKPDTEDTQRYFLPGAKSMKITFSNETKLFHNFDYLYIYDATGKQIGRTYTGDELAGLTVEIPGNAFSIRLTTRVDAGYYGYSIASVYAVVPADAEHVGRLPLAVHTYQDGACTVCGAVEEVPEHIDEDGNGYCDICAERLSPAILHGKSLSLNGDIAINYYMDLSQEVLADENAYMEFRKEDGTVIRVPLAEATKKLRNTENYHVFTIPMTSKEMADVVEAQFFWSQGSTEVYDYSVKTYVDNKLPTCEDEALKELLTAMLHYGAAAQTYFGYHTDRLANEGLEAPDYSGVSIEGFEASKGQATKLLSYCGASLQLNSKTAIRFVFLADSSLQEITASCKGETLEWTREGDYISVIVDDISAKDLDEYVTLTVSDGTETMEVSYSPMTYCRNVRNGNNPVHTPELKALAAALYVYNQAANIYFGDK